jgi:NAD(P)-dependent dehydrogenase (short-subunit alcohol dehydrogenase family)
MRPGSGVCDPDLPDLALRGRVAVVTGAARGIGRACAELFAECGLALAICDRRADELAAVGETLGTAGEVYAEVIDVREPEQVSSFVAHAARRFGGIDVLVNNAGGSFRASFLDVSPKGEAMLIAENFTSAAQLIRECAPHMAGRPGASVINVTSIEAHQAAPGFAVYAAMKAGLANLTRSLALELASSGIRVNAIAPDAIMTGGEESARGHVLDAAAEAGPSFEPVTLPPLGRMGEAKEAASVVLFLASAMASFITGATIAVDGGTRAAGGWRLAKAAD